MTCSNLLLEDAASHLRAGRFAEATALYRDVLAAAPETAGAMQGLAVLALQEGRPEEAADRFRRALVRDPQFAKAYVNLASAVRHGGQLSVSEAALRRAVALQPDLAEAHHNLGNLLAALHRDDEAKRHRTRAASLMAGRETDRGAALSAAGSPDEAVEAFKNAIRLDPEEVEAFINLTSVHLSKGSDAAVETARRAVALAPGRPVTHSLLAVCSRDWFQAAALMQRALVLRADQAEPWYRYGAALTRIRRDEAADRAYRRALALNPAMGVAFMNRSTALSALARPHEAMVVLDRALRIDPDDADVLRNRLVCMMYVPDADPPGLFAEHRRYAERLAPKLAVLARPHANSADPNRRLRIGYVSSDLSGHPVGRNLMPLVEAHDRGRFELAFYADVARPDAMTERFRALAGLWRTTTGRSDAEVAEMVRADGVDILVVLAGRFDRNRPLVAAARPAPIQVSFHDAATSGLSGMDYLIGDRVLNPRGGPESFTERVIRLPSFYLHAPLEGAPRPGPPPVLHQGRITFGSFNNPAKVNDRVLALWARVLHAVPGSRLVLKYVKQYGMPSVAAYVRGMLESHGIARERLVLPAAAQDTEEHLGLYRGIDIALDTFPFSGSTTTFEALWMGVPVITLPGSTMISRWSASMLTALKLDSLVADSPDDFVTTAASLAVDPDRLAELRAGLRDRVADSPLCDARLKARHIERAYRTVWRHWCAGHASLR